MKQFGLLFAAACLSLSAAAQTITITHANLIDVSKNTTLPDQTIIVENDRITTIGPAAKVKVPAGAQVIDATGKYVMPGMTDAHIHFFQTGGLYTRPDAVNLKNVYPYEKDQAYAKAHLSDLMARYLACGITTVIDVGGPFSNYDIRNWAEKDALAANTWVTGPLISTYVPPNLDEKDPPIIKVNTAEEARELVRKQVPYKPDFIKIWYIAGKGLKADSTYPLIKAAIDESHAHGLKVCVHATEYATAKLAVTAGADILVHSVDDEVLDKDMLQLLKDKHIIYIPTLTVMQGYYRTFSQNFAFSNYDLAYGDPFMLGTLTDLQHIQAPFSYKAMREKRHIPSKTDTTMLNNLLLAEKAGITVAAGTDAGNIGTLHASSFLKELFTMQEAGLTNREVLRAATLNAALGFGKGKDYGSIEKGKIADLLVLDQDPVQNLHALESIQTVIHKGKVFHPAQLLPVTPESLVQQQVNGYNFHNLDAFLAPYSDSIVLYDQRENKVFGRGKAAIREMYRQVFSKAPELHCQIVNRMVNGNTVIDQEKVTGLNDYPIEGIAIYTIDHDKIVKVTFIHQ